MMTVLDIEQLYCNLFLSKLGGGCFILFLIINIVEEKSGISLCFFAGNHFFLLLWCLCFLFFSWNETLLICFRSSNPICYFCLVILNWANLFSSLYCPQEFTLHENLLLVSYIKCLLESCQKDNLEILKISSSFLK